MNHIEFGKEGERLAVNHLLSKNHSILNLNYRYRRGEIDIISESGAFIVATEVKTRQSRKHGSPADAVSRSKQRQLVQIMDAYIMESNNDKEVRFDVVSIILNQYEASIEHIEGAFYPLV
ncbi:MAG: YraN family protein [Crocinitomicaceae bacterium]|nr:YraN family protein [Crocinitomicaceae bacterium]MDG1658488.1 YraN family protein [Crocinitomicaceae bacterium]MDG2440321.1 YraN family protein [Crocinitomicaceae bacterium]|tara:strand:- start:38 stop:397 length:360 start_codon:yes stop_codon:yes gene_type:complete